MVEETSTDQSKLKSEDEGEIEVEVRTTRAENSVLRRSIDPTTGMIVFEEEDRSSGSEVRTLRRHSEREKEINK
ncbi:hypothetical protein H4Q26_002197 [Puccinia striiformis f. sp. tritici PST-130]|nr:hypothetical protein H4Q26_002197 [Puccinia striiformis f. sp. tritici PST-130]